MTLPVGSAALIIAGPAYAAHVAAVEPQRAAYPGCRIGLLPGQPGGSAAGPDFDPIPA
jgi:hypothetical protein